MFLDGSKRRLCELSSLYLGKGVYRPGWRLSKHVGAEAGMASQHHVGDVISGPFVIGDVDGNQVEVGSGDAFEVGPSDDASVLGDEPGVALDVRVR